MARDIFDVLVWGAHDEHISGSNASYIKWLNKRWYGLVGWYDRRHIYTRDIDLIIEKPSRYLRHMQADIQPWATLRA